MMIPLLDTNVIVRFLVETPESIPKKFKGVFSFFHAVERGDKQCMLADVVIFQCYYVLTSYYEVPHISAIEQLEKICLLRGIHLQNKAVMMGCLKHLKRIKTDFVDAYLCEWSQQHHVKDIYSFDKGFNKLSMKVLKVE